MYDVFGAAGCLIVHPGTGTGTGYSDSYRYGDSQQVQLHEHIACLACWKRKSDIRHITMTWSCTSAVAE